MTTETQRDYMPHLDHIESHKHYYFTKLSELKDLHSSSNSVRLPLSSIAGLFVEFFPVDFSSCLSPLRSLF